MLTLFAFGLLATILVPGSVLLITELRNAPVGYQDDLGFHHVGSPKAENRAHASGWTAESDSDLHVEAPPHLSA
jgi:hypothetical protein